VSISTSPLIVYKALFSNSSYAFRTQEWFNRVRVVVLREAQDSVCPLLAFWLAGQPVVDPSVSRSSTHLNLKMAIAASSEALGNLERL
jgi:hypothetical protein